MNGLRLFVQRNGLAVALIAAALLWCHTGWAKEPETAAADLTSIKVLDLQTAANIALAENPSLEAAQARLAQAREVVRQARSAYWPRLDLVASQNRTYLSDNAYQYQLAINQALFGPGATLEDPEDLYQASIGASWLVFDGLARWYKLQSAKHGEQSVEAARDDARRLLLRAISNAFLSAQLALENIAIAKADESFNQRQLTEAKLRHEVGTGALSDVLNFEVKANTAKSNRIFSETTYETARIGLAVLLGIEQARLPASLELAALGQALEAELQPPQPEQSLEEAYSQRPDLMQIDQVVRQAEADVKVKRGSYYPIVSLSAAYGGETTEDYFGFEDEDFGYRLGIDVTFNIFAGGLFAAQHQEAKMRLREAEKNLQSIKLDVTSEVRSTIEDVLSAQKQYLLLRTNAELVQRNRDLVEKEYKAGVGSLVRLNEAQRDLTAAQVRLATAQVALRQAWYDLWSASGQIEAKLVR